MTYDELKQAKQNCEEKIKTLKKEIANKRKKIKDQENEIEKINREIEFLKMVHVLKETKDENGMSGYDKFMKMK